MCPSALRLHAAQRLARAQQRADDVDLEHRAEIGDRALTIGANVPMPAEHTTMSSVGQLGEPRLDLGLVGDVEVGVADLAELGSLYVAARIARPHASTAAPSSARACAHAAPIPLDPPVTIANLPSSRFHARRP